MRVLFVTAAPPWPPYSGASLRSYHFIRLLAPRHEVHLVCYASVREEVQLLEGLGPYCRSIRGVPQPAPRGPWRRALQVATLSQPDLALRLGASTMRHAIGELCSAHDLDLVHVVGLEVLPAVLFPDLVLEGRKKIVLDEQNAEYLLQERAFEVARGDVAQWPVALYSWLQARKLCRFEGALSDSLAGVITTSAEDAAALRGILPRAPITVVSNGVDTQCYRPLAAPAPAPQPLQELSPDTPLVLFTGTMDFRPNVDAVVWFSNEILPRIRKRLPDVHFAIMGRDPGAAVRALARPYVTVTGMVAEDLPYFHRASVFVLPMRFGGGSRLKLLQALSCGLPVVTTAMGAAGVALTHEQHGLIAEAPEDFAQAVVRVLQDTEVASHVGRGARELALKYEWSAVIPRLESFYRELTATAVSV